METISLPSSNTVLEYVCTTRGVQHYDLDVFSSLLRETPDSWKHSKYNIYTVPTFFPQRNLSIFSPIGTQGHLSPAIWCCLKLNSSSKSWPITSALLYYLKSYYISFFLTLYFSCFMYRSECSVLKNLILKLRLSTRLVKFRFRVQPLAYQVIQGRTIGTLTVVENTFAPNERLFILKI